MNEAIIAEDGVNQESLRYFPELKGLFDSLKSRNRKKYPLVKLRSDGCWEWVRTINRFGYGSISADSKSHFVHRFIYERIVGKVPGGLQLDHLCRFRRCVNPSHLEPVTSAENTLRGETIAARNLVKTHCMRGHEFTPENTRLFVQRTKRPKRSCRTCERERSEIYYLKNKIEILADKQAERDAEKSAH